MRGESEDRRDRQQLWVLKALTRISEHKAAGSDPAAFLRVGVYCSRSDAGCSPRTDRAEAGTGLSIRMQALGHKRLQAGLRTGSSGLRGLSAPVKAVPRGRPGHSPRSGRAEAERVYPFRCRSSGIRGSRRVCERAWRREVVGVGRAPAELASQSALRDVLRTLRQSSGP